MPRIKREKTWNERREQFLQSVLRLNSITWPAAAEAKKRFRTARKINPQTGKLCWHARCNGCRAEFLERELAVDHIDPVVPVDRDYSQNAYDPKTLGELMVRLLPEPLDLQTLCFECHAQKTEAENEERKTNRNNFNEEKKT